VLSAQGKTEILYQIGRIEAGGWTNLWSGWLIACQEVTQAQATETGSTGANRVLLLSDGLANVGTTDPTELVEQARQSGAQGIVTSTMGVGADFNGDLLEAMARQGGGRFQYVESAPQIPDCVQGELGELLQLAARGVAVEIALPVGVHLRECLNEFPIEHTKQGIRFRLGDLTAGDTRQILLALHVDAGAIVDHPVELQALALFTDVETGRGTELTFPEAWLRPADAIEVDAQRPDPRVETEIALLHAAEARKEAVRLSILGDDRAAHEVLVGAFQSLSANAYAAHPAVATQIRSLSQHATQARLGFTRAQQKELGYQAYLLREARSRYGKPR
jgi:Ca-activated chloride channel family protein